MLIAVNHHYIRDQYNLPYPGINGITPAFFKDKLLALKKHGVFVSAKQIADAVDGIKELPAHAIVITFDDGLKEQYELALPILDEVKIPALFFVNTINSEAKVSNVHKIHLLRSYVSPEIFFDELQKFIKQMSLDEINFETAKKAGADHYIYDDVLTAGVKYILNFVLSAEQLHSFTDQLFPKYFKEEEIAQQLYMSTEQLSILAERGYLGSHGHEHLPLAQLSDKEAAFQIQRSQEIIKGITGNPVYAFSYPYGSEEACKGLGRTIKNNWF